MRRGWALLASTGSLAAALVLVPGAAGGVDPADGGPNEVDGIYESDCKHMCSFPDPPDGDRDDDEISDYHENGAGVVKTGRTLYDECLRSGTMRHYDGRDIRLTPEQCASYYPSSLFGKEYGYPTDPLDPDTDSDGLKDGREVHGFEYDPRTRRIFNRAPTSKPHVWDTDREGLSDGLEVRYMKTNPQRRDTDRDRLTDSAEGIRHRTNPRKPDTDRDCRSDGYEVRHGTDPLRINVGYVILYCSSVREKSIRRQYPNLRRRRPPRLRPPADPCKLRRWLCRRPRRLVPTPTGLPQAVVRAEQAEQQPPPPDQSSGLPDLVVSSIDSLIYDSPNERCLVTFTRRNQGGARSGESDTSVRVFSPSFSEERTGPAGSLDPGESRAETVVIPSLGCSTAESEVSVTVAADARSDVQESDEGNNARSRTFGPG